VREWGRVWYGKVRSVVFCCVGFWGWWSRHHKELILCSVVTLCCVWRLPSDGMAGREDSSLPSFGLKKPKLKETECSIQMDHFLTIGPFGWMGYDLLI